MNNEQMAARIRELYENGDMEKFAQAQREMAADDMVQEWPQSGERIRGLANIEAVNQNYPASTGTSPKMELRRILKPGEAWIIEGTIDYGDGIPVSAVSIIETADGKIVRQTDYFANPFEAPAWRSKWVEHMEPVAAR
jgi:SnoaL-like protein